jgi:hypothetical protein
LGKVFLSAAEGNRLVAQRALCVSAASDAETPDREHVRQVE